MGLGCLGFRVLAEVECHLMIGLGSNDVRRKNQQQARAGPEESREWSHSGPIKNRSELGATAMQGINTHGQEKRKAVKGGPFHARRPTSNAMAGSRGFRRRKKEAFQFEWHVSRCSARPRYSWSPCGRNECVCVCVFVCLCVCVFVCLCVCVFV